MSPYILGRTMLVSIFLLVAGASADATTTRLYTETFNDGDFDQIIQSNARDVTITFPSEGRSGSGALKVTGDHKCSEVHYDIYRDAARQLYFEQPPGSRTRVRLYRKMSGSKGRLFVSAVVNPSNFDIYIPNLIASTDGPSVGKTGWQLFETDIPANLTNVNRALRITISVLGPGGTCAETAGPFTFWIDDVTIDHIDTLQTGTAVTFENNSWRPFALEVPDATSGRISTYAVGTNAGDRALQVVGTNACAWSRLQFRFTQPYGQASNVELFVKSTSTTVSGTIVLSAGGVYAEKPSGSYGYQKLSLTVPPPPSSPVTDRDITAIISVGGPQGTCSSITPFTFWIDDIKVVSRFP